MNRVSFNRTCFDPNTRIHMRAKASQLGGKELPRINEWCENFTFDDPDKGKEFFEYINTQPTIEES